MIPLHLNLRNFMSYTDVHEPLRFDGIHVAVLAGDNGHGKSALLDAITWSLWGQSRARTVDDLIHTGATEMEVEFEFLLDGQHYRVIRKRQRRGKTGISDLQFAVLANGSYRPLTERSVNETEKAIQRTLKMSYETFTSSSFIQQGRADAFTTNQPAERKRILAEILELGYYDELEAKAKEAVRQRELQVREERARIQEWEQEIARRPEYHAAVEHLKGELAQLEERVRALEGQCDVARERVARLESAQRALEEAEARLARYAADRERARALLRETRVKLAEAQDVLSRAEAIERAAAELAAVRGDLEAADRKLQAYLPLVQAREKAQSALETERARLEAHLTALLRQVTEIKQAAERREALQAELQQAAKEVEALGRLEEQQGKLQAEAVRCREEAAEKRTINKQLKNEMVALKARIDDLATLATCPACQRPMDASHKAKLRGTYEAEGKELAVEFRANEKQCKDLQASVVRHDAELAQLAATLAGREAAQRRLASAESAVEQAKQAEQRLMGLQQELAELEGILTAQQFAPEARSQLADVERRMAELAYDEAGHKALRARAGELAGAEAEKQRLDRARVATEHLALQEREAEASIARLDEETTAEEQRCAALRQERAKFESERARLQEVQAALQQARSEYGRTREQHAQALARLDYCALAERRVADSLALQDALRREIGIFSDLAHAFGKKGVQAMIIETAIPEIEEEANRLLARMTDGRMHVKFETQRDMRAGTGTIETLDIKIGDELGTRSYEMFSGGESFRVNFAIRIALSKLLARRAGTKLQTLVVDEGFGSQDAEGRDRLVEAIQAIQDEFEKILVITHLEDLRERFPVRIEVRKTPRGSLFTLR